MFSWSSSSDLEAWFLQFRHFAMVSLQQFKWGRRGGCVYHNVVLKCLHNFHYLSECNWPSNQLPFSGSRIILWTQTHTLPTVKNDTVFRKKATGQTSLICWWPGKGAESYKRRSLCSPKWKTWSEPLTKRHLCLLSHFSTFWTLGICLLKCTR